MTNKDKKKEDNIENQENEDVVEEITNEEEKASGDTPETVEKAEEIDPIAEANEKYLRLMAEYDNFKKRTQKEKLQIYTDSVVDVIKAVLPFIDNIARATSVEVESDDAKKLLEGVKLVERQFGETLKNLGVEEIKAVGEKLDPNLHNAVMHVDDEAIDGEEIIVEEFMKGYIYRDKVIRHSTVKVAN